MQGVRLSATVERHIIQIYSRRLKSFLPVATNNGKDNSRTTAGSRALQTFGIDLGCGGLTWCAKFMAQKKLIEIERLPHMEMAGIITSR